jgi:mannan endo-1,4-beta-mannosidase
MRLFASVLLAALCAAAAPAEPAAPVTPNASPEAAALLRFLYGISGNHILTGQHNYPDSKALNSEFASRYIGKTPVIFGKDWGHSEAGDKDSYLARPNIVQEAIREHQMGAIVALCWHAAPPTADEPVTFALQPNSDPKVLKSVQGQLLDDQFRDLLTPGTPLYNHWCAQVDTVAAYLKELQDAHVPVLWRPLHEMNGSWFWWGGRTGQYSTAALYRQLFDRLVNHHHLNNLVWVWSVDRPSKPGMEHEKYFPGSEYVDVLALDVYGSDFAQSYYDSLVSLSKGKPIALAEVGNPPTPDVLDRQPLWTYYMTWAGMVRNTTHKQYKVLMADPRILSLEDPAYAAATADYRKACGLPALRFEPKPVDFSGTWVLDEDRSVFGRMGAGFSPAKLEVTQSPGALSVRSTRIVEDGPDEVADQRYALDGSSAPSKFMRWPSVLSAKLSPSADHVLITTTVTGAFGMTGSTMTVTEVWTVDDGGGSLSIHRTTVSPRGTQDTTLVFSRR